MTCPFWHGPHFSLLETQCHLETTHLWIQPLGRSKIFQHLQHKRAKHCLKIWKTFLTLGNNTSCSKNPIIYYRIQRKIRENQDDTYLLPIAVLNSWSSLSKIFTNLHYSSDIKKYVSEQLEFVPKLWKCMETSSKQITSDFCEATLVSNWLVLFYSSMARMKVTPRKWEQERPGRSGQGWRCMQHLQNPQGQQKLQYLLKRPLQSQVR